METTVDNQTIESLRAKLAEAINYMPVRVQSAYLEQIDAVSDDEIDHDWVRRTLIFLIKIKAQETSSRLQAAEMPYTDTLYHTDQAQRIYEAPFSDESLIRRALYLTYQGDLVTYERMSGKGSLQSFRRPKEKISDFDSDNLDAFLEALSIMDAYAR